MIKNKLIYGLGLGAIMLGMVSYGLGGANIPESISVPVNAHIFEISNDSVEVNEVFKKDLPVVKKIMGENQSMTATRNNLNKEKNIPDHMGQSYKVHVFLADFIEIYDQSKDFSSIIPTDYQIEAPLLDADGNVISTSLVWKYKGKWEIAQSGLYIPVEYVEISASPDRISKLLLDNNITDIKQVNHVRFLTKTTDALFVETNDGKEYLIPMSFRSDLTGLENLKVYEVNEAMDILRKK